MARIESRGHTVRRAVQDDAAQKLVSQHLRRRATAQRRIGVAYQLRELADPGQWIATPCLAGNKGDYYPLPA